MTADDRSGFSSGSVEQTLMRHPILPHQIDSNLHITSVSRLGQFCSSNMTARSGDPATIVIDHSADSQRLPPGQGFEDLRTKEHGIQRCDFDQEAGDLQGLLWLNRSK